MIIKSDDLNLKGYYPAKVNDKGESRCNDCTLCDGVKTKKPFCSFISGVFEGMGIFVAGFYNIRCEETICKASGGAECRYEIIYGD